MKAATQSGNLATVRPRKIGAKLAAAALLALGLLACPGCDKVLLGTDLRQSLYQVFQSGLSSVAGQLQSDISTAVQQAGTATTTGSGK